MSQPFTTAQVFTGFEGRLVKLAVSRHRPLLLMYLFILLTDYK